MKHATIEDYDSICALFDKHREHFPYFRRDGLMDRLNGYRRGGVVYESGVVISYHYYGISYKIGNVRVNSGDVIINELAKEDGGDAKGVVSRFFDYVARPVWLTVRRDNIRAKKFYDKMGMKIIGEIFWGNGRIEGDVYVYGHSDLNKFMV